MITPRPFTVTRRHARGHREGAAGPESETGKARVMLRTRITADYGLELPIVSAGMAFVGTPTLVAAVSNAGGMGTLGAALAPSDGLRRLIRAVRAQTARAFAVDFITDCVEEEHIDVCLEERVPVVVFFWSLPDATCVRRLRANGTRVWMQIGSVAEATAAAEAGADAVVVQGGEAGGHNGSFATTFDLVPAIVDAIAPVPVIAACGIVDGRGIAAGLALGAEAIWCGTRCLTRPEAGALDLNGARALRASVTETVRKTLFAPDWPERPLKPPGRNRPSAPDLRGPHDLVRGMAEEAAEVIRGRLRAMLPTAASDVTD